MDSLKVSVSDSRIARSLVQPPATPLSAEQHWSSCSHTTACRCDAPVWGPCRL